MNEQAYNYLRDAIKKALSKEDVELSDLDLDYDRDMLGDYLAEDRNLWQALNALEDDRYNDEYKGKDRAERVEEEVVARCCESFLRDSKFVRQMAEQHYRSAREITRFLKQFAKDVSTVQVDAAVRAYEGGYDTNDISPENNMLRDYADIEKIADLWVKGLREIADKRAKAKKATGEVKASQMDKVQTSDNKQWYDYSRSWKEQVDDWIAGKIPAEDTLVLGGTPSILQRVGFTALPMLVEQEHLDYWINHTYKDEKGRRRNNHDFTKEQVYQFPEKIAHPLAIIASQSTKPGVREKSIVVYIEMENKGRQIIVPIHLSYEGKQNGLKVDANLHASAYGKQSSIDELEKALKAEIDGKTEVFYINKNAISLANAPIGLAAIKALTEKVHSSDGFVHNITDNDSPVKINPKNLRKLCNLIGGSRKAKYR